MTLQKVREESLVDRSIRIAPVEPASPRQVCPVRLALLSALVLIGACATAPTEPGVLALPGTGKTLEQFNADHDECRKRASAPPGDAASGSWTEQQRRYDFAYIQCMYVKGHRVPVPGQFTGAPTGNPPPPPPGKPEQAPQ
jgi:hypothetical protein